MKVLIVDDSIINLKVATKLLEKEGCVVENATSGIECLEKAQNTTYDLIFMDIMMPEMDGVETFNKLREMENFNTPVITLTADAEPNAKEKYLTIGFNDYIAKPIQIIRLQEVLERYK